MLKSIASALGQGFDFLYQATGSFLMVMVLAAILSSATKTIVAFVKLRNKEKNIKFYPEIQRIKNLGLSKEEEAEEINKLGISGIGIILPVVCSVFRYFIGVAIFITVMNPYEYIPSLDTSTQIPFLYMDNMLEQKFDFILPIIASTITLIGKNFFVPKEVFDLKKNLLNFAVSALTYMLISLITTQSYVVLMFLMAIVSCLTNIAMTPYKVKIYKLQKEAQKQAQENNNTCESQ